MAGGVNSQAAAEGWDLLVWPCGKWQVGGWPVPVICAPLFTLQGEQEEYAREGIAWSYIDFVDNQDCLDL